MAKYAKHVSTASKATPQSKKATETQVQNQAGGFVFKVNDWICLNRFLIIGNENGSYYASEEEKTIKNYQVVLRCLKEDGKRTVDTILSISDEGRAMKNLPAIFALAVCSVFGDEETKAYANKVMPKVARYSTDFFTWVDAVTSLKEGHKGKGLLRAIGRWYTEKSAEKLAYQICKYPGRSVGSQKWTHGDMLRLCRISPSKNGKSARNGKALTLPSKEHDVVFKYATHGVTSPEEMAEKEKLAIETGKAQKSAGLSLHQLDALKGSALDYIWAHEKCKASTSVKEIVGLILNHGLTRESVAPDLRNNIEIQRALLPTMPMTALIRNLGGMTASGLLKPLSDETSMVIQKITDEENIHKGRIHPMTILMALKVYGSGSGIRTEWKPVPTIKDALEDAFYKAFNYVEPTNKKYLLGIDVSGSMGGFSWGRSDKAPLTPREAAAVVAMTIARTEKNHHLMAFTHQFSELKISAKDSLDTVVRKTTCSNFGGTDCALPMIYASENSLDVDVFVVLTDNETWAGSIHPFQALKEYRKNFNKNAKLAVLAFEASEFSIADPNDAGMMDIAGLDSNVPKVLSEFALGNI